MLNHLRRRICNQVSLNKADLRFLRLPKIKLLATPEIFLERIDFACQFFHADARARRRR